MNSPKPKKCKVCPTKFIPFSTTQQACSPKCALELVERKKAKERRKDTVERRKALKSKSDLLKEAQQAFNAYIRERDKDQPCISCGRHHNGQYHAGHYLTVGAHPELRFEELNCRKQCAPCNDHLSGNIVRYRQNLIEKIGLDKVEWLEGPHKPKHYSREDIIEIKEKYKKKRKELLTSS